MDSMIFARYSFRNALLAAAKALSEDLSLSLIEIDQTHDFTAAADEIISFAFADSNKELVLCRSQDFLSGTSIDPKLREIVGDLLEAVCAAFPARKWQLTAARRSWSVLPEFHVDATFATLIIPVSNAPTHYSSNPFLGRNGKSLEGTMPLGMAAFQVDQQLGEIQTTDWGAPVLFKGLAWGNGHSALIHCPPCSTLLPSAASPKTAVALIVDIQ